MRSELKDERKRQIWYSHFSILFLWFGLMKVVVGWHMCKCSSCSEKFHEIYNFAFGWAKEKVIKTLIWTTSCFQELLFSVLVINSLLWNVSGSEVSCFRYSDWDVAAALCGKRVAIVKSLVWFLAGKETLMIGLIMFLLLLIQSCFPSSGSS